MARNINFQYYYPYSVQDENSRYYSEQSSNPVFLNGNNVSTRNFKKSPAPYIIDVTITISLNPMSGTNASGRSWRLYYYIGRWEYFTFTMPYCAMNEWTSYTLTGTIGNYVTMFAVCPDTSGSYGYGYNLRIDKMKVRETITTTDLITNDYFSVFPSMSGLEQKPTRVFTNISGTLIPTKKILVNIDDALTELTPVYSGAFTSSAPDTMRVYEFTPPISGIYRFEARHGSGYHDAQLYDSIFNKMDTEAYFHNGSFTLTGGSLYYILLSHHYSYTSQIDSVLLINKTPIG